MPIFIDFMSSFINVDLIWYLGLETFSQLVLESDDGSVSKFLGKIIFLSYLKFQILLG